MHSLLVAVAIMLPAVVQAATLADMQGQRRVLVIAAPVDKEPHLAAQRRALAGWRRGAADRDVSIVEVVGNSTTGASDSATTLRQRYTLPPDVFSVILIGKDGHVALRTSTPLAAPRLEGAIDAMPMRRAGQR